MSVVKRPARFYELEVLDQHDATTRVSLDFWSKAFDELERVEQLDREFTHLGTRYYGDVRTATAPAVRYLYFGRLRERGQFPDAYRSGAGVQGPLDPGGDDVVLSEPTYVLPFGGRNYVTALAPVSSATRSTVINAWLNAMLGYIATDERLQITPLLDPTLQRKLERSLGATRTRVRLTPDQALEATVGDAGEALRAAGRVAPGEAVVEVTWSFGRRGAGSSTARQSLLDAARTFRRSNVKAAEVSLEVPNEDGIGSHIETHDLVEDRAVVPVPIRTETNGTVSAEAALNAMLKAAEDFQAQERQAQ